MSHSNSHPSPLSNTSTQPIEYLSSQDASDDAQCHSQSIEDAPSANLLGETTLDDDLHSEKTASGISLEPPSGADATTNSDLSGELPPLSEIIQFVKDTQASGRLSSDSLKLSEHVITLAQVAIEEGTEGSPALHVAWAIYSPLAGDILRLKKDHSDLQVHVRRIEFLMSMGDWIGDVLKSVESAKTEHSATHAKALGSFFNAQGLTTAAVNGLKRLHSKWTKFYFPGRMNQELCRLITAEHQAVVNWRLKGESPLTAPFTPFLDRMVHLCKEETFDPGLFVELVHFYEQRNRSAHNPPPRAEEGFVKPNSQGMDITERIDWEGMRLCCVQKKTEIEKLYSEQVIDKKTRDLAIKVVDAWWSSTCKGGVWSGTIVPTERAESVVLNACVWEDNKEADSTQAASLPSFQPHYYVGKWDYLPELPPQ